MKIRVDLYGTLSQKVPGYRPSQGIEVELQAGATARDLLDLLKISQSEGAVVAIEGRIKKPDEILPGGARAQIFQTVHGG
jgi:sulfur carrier protein ThiS